MNPLTPPAPPAADRCQATQEVDYLDGMVVTRRYLPCVRAAHEDRAHLTYAADGRPYWFHR